MYFHVIQDDVTSEIIISDLMEEQPPARTVLDIQDTRRYFESQSRTQDQHLLTNGVRKQTTTDQHILITIWR